MNVNTEEQRDEMIDEIARSRRANTDYYAVSNEVRLGRYPGGVVSTHPSHFDAVEAMFRLNEAAGMDDRVDDPCEEYPDYGPTDPSPAPRIK